MNTNTTQATITKTGVAVHVLETLTGGWSKIKDGKDEKKVRTNTLTFPPAPVESVTKAKKVTAAAVDSKEDAPIAVAAAKVAPPKKDPVPAHFVGDRTPGKTAKIGNTEVNLDRYFVSDTKTPSGRRTIDTNDEIAQSLRGLPLEQVYQLAAETTGISVEELQDKYAGLNTGMQRMNLGNRIRGAEGVVEREAKAAEKKAEREANAEAKRIEREIAKNAKDAEKLQAAEAKEAARKAATEAKAAETAKASAAKRQ